MYDKTPQATNALGLHRTEKEREEMEEKASEVWLTMDQSELQEEDMQTSVEIPSAFHISIPFYPHGI